MAGSKMIAAGYVCVDITPQFPESYQGRKLEDVVRPGKLRKIGSASISTGGSVANTGLALHALGADVSLIAKIGADAFGGIVQEAFRQQGTEPDFIISKDVDTSYTIVIAVPGNDRCFLVDSGANDAFYPEDLPYDKIARADYFHFGYPSLMRSFYEDGGTGLARMLERVQKLGLITSLDMALPDAASGAGSIDWEELCRRALPFVDFFVPSIEELGFMLDRERYEAWQKRAKETGDDICMTLSLEEDVKPLAKKALDLGCGSILLKCGAAGLYYRASDEMRMCGIGARARLHARQLSGDEPREAGVGQEDSPEHASAACAAEGGMFTGQGWGDADLFQKSYRPDRIRSGTGAGDTAIAGFLYGVSHGMDPDTCLKIAAGCGSMCITQYDSLSGLLPAAQLLERIEAGWETQDFIRP